MNPEIANTQDARVEALWGQGKLDVTALKKGLRKLDHRMRRALE
jgi:solute carrier family 25 phosphate transporter 23/24/25/41